MRKFLIGAVVCAAFAAGDFACTAEFTTADGGGGSGETGGGATTSVGGASGSSTSSTGGKTTSSSVGGGGAGSTASAGGGGASSSSMSSSTASAGGGGSSSSTGGGGAGGSAPTCPTNGNLLFTGNSCYEYQVYSGGVFQPPPQASDPDAMCESSDCSVNVIPGDLVLYWSSMNTLKFTGNVNSVECKCSAFVVPPQKAGIVVELNAQPAPTTMSDSGSGQNHQYVVAACGGAISCQIHE